MVNSIRLNSASTHIAPVDFTLLKLTMAYQIQTAGGYKWPGVRL